MNKVSTASKSLFSSRRMAFLIPAIFAIFLLGIYIAFSRFNGPEKTASPAGQRLTSTPTSTPSGQSSDFPVKVVNGIVEDVSQGKIKVNVQDETRDFQPDNNTEYWLASTSGDKEPQKIKEGKIDLVKKGDSVIVASREDDQKRILVTSIIIYR